MKYLISLAAVLCLGACAGPPETLVVKQFQLRDQVRDTGEEPMVRMEKARHLRGAVSMEERGKRLGQYYTLIWSDPKGVGTGKVDVVFQYQQGGSASRVKRMTKQFPSSASQGTVELAVVGDDYLKNGRVLAWQATVSRGSQELASKRSYLWR